MRKTRHKVATSYSLEKKHHILVYVDIKHLSARDEETIVRGVREAVKSMRELRKYGKILAKKLPSEMAKAARNVFEVK